MSKFGKLLTAAALVIAAVGIGFGADNKDFAERYKNRYFVVMRDGLILGVNPDHPGTKTYLQVEVSDSGSQAKTGFMAGSGAPERVHKGEVLRSSKYVRVHSGHLWLCVESLSPHSITRGVGAFQHESQEYPDAILLFPLEGGYEQAGALVDKWLKTFDTQEEAAKFGNTASGAFVKEVKLGMTPAEVESVLGLPETKIDLGEKVLYKYKNMTVEFKDGKVSDVR